MNNLYRIDQWKNKLEKQLLEIETEKKYLEKFFGEFYESAIASYGKAPKLHKLYMEADSLVGKILKEEKTEEARDLLYWYYN